jgi:hypothetical protein
MDYQWHYDRLVARARERKLSCKSERHHIVPKCLGGSDETENLVNLTLEEHYVAHQLLTKIHPSNFKLAYAATMMANTRGNKAFGWLRKRASELAKGTNNLSPEQCKANGKLISQALKNKPKSAAHRANISAARKLNKDSVSAKLSKVMMGNKSRATGHMFSRIAASYLISF